MIEVRNISCSYKTVYVLDNFSLDIEEGKPFFILGKNGCGKSTLLKALLKNLELKVGDIVIDGESSKAISISRMAKLFSYVPQLSDINIDYKVIDYLLFGLNGSFSLFSSPKKEDYDKVIQIAEEYGLSQFLGCSFNELSGGEKQMIMTMRAIVQDTKYILMDEPTSTLDLDNQYRFRGIVNKLTKVGKTIICVSHDPNIPLNIDCNVALMGKGEIIKCGSCIDVLNEENLSNVYECKLHITESEWGKTICFESN